MLKKKMKLLGFRLRNVVFFCFVLIVCAGCDRGATEQIQAAEKFSDAVTRNEGARRDSMIATHKFKEYFQNEYVAADFLKWFRSFYDLKERKFVLSARADVDRDLSKELEGVLIDTNKIEATGVVRVLTPDGDKSAYFWMVKQEGQHWKVAIVTKGDMTVQFKPSQE
jgi:hypothetical protein